MIWEGFYVCHKLGLARARRRPTDTARKGDHEASVTALIGADLEQFRRHHTVKAGPVKAGIAMVYLAGKGCHEGYWI